MPITLIFFFGHSLMSKEHERRGFYDLYKKIKHDENYFVIIDENISFYLQLLGDDLFIDNGNCFMRIENFNKQKIKVYKFEPTETYMNFNIKEAKILQKLESTELFYSN